MTSNVSEDVRDVYSKSSDIFIVQEGFPALNQSRLIRFKYLIIIVKRSKYVNCMDVFII